MKLQDYPRPKNDNGISIHFRLDLAETGNKPYISQGIQYLKQINAKWTLVAGQDWNQIGQAAGMIWQAGIMPICRLICKIDRYNDWALGVRTLQNLGIPPYIQIFNEPGDSREWRGTPNINTFGAKWAEAAAIVYDAGGYPGVGAVLGQNEWQAAFAAVQGNNRMDIWNRAWFCVHNYGSNHPLDYPNDDVNQKGTPVTPQEYAQMQFSLPIDEVNALRQRSAHPGSTIMTDDTSILRFLEFKAWMVESLGYCLPMIGGEGGWEWAVEEDHRYSKLTPEQHASYHKSMFEWFRTGVLSNGVPLPDELFCLAPWLMADWGADDWWYGTLGTKQGTIDAVASIPPFVRKFSWDQTSPPPPPPPTFSATPSQIQAGQSATLSWNAPGAQSMTVNNAGVAGPQGSMVVSPQTTTTYTLKVVYPAGDSVSLTATVTVTPVTPPPPPPPPTFSATPSQIPAGQSATLAWNAPGSQALHINGNIVAGPQGSMEVSPQTTTTYALRVDYPDGSSGWLTATITVTPVTPPGFIYIVQQGETLWGIARKFGTTVAAIVQANHISDPNKIYAGQQLLIPR